MLIIDFQQYLYNNFVRQKGLYQKFLFDLFSENISFIINLCYIIISFIQVSECHHRYAMLSFTGIYFYISFSWMFLMDERGSLRYTIKYSMQEITQHTLRKWKYFIQIWSCFRWQRYIYLKSLSISLLLKLKYCIYKLS